MTQRNFLQLSGIAVAIVWVFCITFAIAYTIRRSPDSNSPAYQQTVISTGEVTFPPKTTATTGSPFTAASTTANHNSTLFQGNIQPDTTSAVVSVSDVNPHNSTTESTVANSAVPQKKNDIINAYVNGINALKNTQNFSMKKNDTLNVNITDVEMTGGAALKNTVMQFANSIIAPPEPENYTFIGGYDAATGKTPNSTIAPLNASAQVNPDAVTSASSHINADGGYTVELTIRAETQTMHSPAPNLSTMVQVIDVSSLLPDGATLTDVNINYAPSVIKATFDSTGRIVSIEHTLTSKGSGSGKMIINVTLKMEGTYTSNYIITYN